MRFDSHRRDACATTRFMGREQRSARYNIFSRASFAGRLPTVLSFFSRNWECRGEGWFRVHGCSLVTRNRLVQIQNDPADLRPRGKLGRV